MRLLPVARLIFRRKRLKLEVLHGITTRKFEQVLDLQGLDKRISEDCLAAVL